MSYDNRDALRAAKELTAAGQDVLDAHHRLAGALGVFLGIAAEMSSAPAGMTPEARRIDTMIGNLAAAYDVIADEVQSWGM